MERLFVAYDEAITIVSRNEYTLSSCTLLVTRFYHLYIVAGSYLQQPFLLYNRYILEGKELEFYMKKLQRKKGKGATAQSIVMDVLHWGVADKIFIMAFWLVLSSAERYVGVLQT